jgi:glucuronoarabinoxylan endo-1,4-beta-xylanase
MERKLSSLLVNDERSTMPPSSTTCLTAMRKGHCRLQFILCGVLLATLLLDPTTSLYAQRADRLRPTASDATITINGSQHNQTMDGFGMSEAFGQANAVRTLSSQSGQKQILDTFFSISKGAGFTILRNILPSDTPNTIEPKNPGSPNATPQYQWNSNNPGESEGQVWLSKQASKIYKVKQFYLDAWSAPGYMKTTGTENNGGALCGTPGASCPSGDWRRAYANYLVQYVRDYQKEGIPISYIGPVNEPGFKTGYSSIDMNPAQAADFDAVLAKALQSTIPDPKLRPHIVCCDPVGWGQTQGYADALANNDSVQVISGHGYGGAPKVPLTGISRKHTWETEWGTLNDQWNASWDDGGDGSGFTWAQHIYDGLAKANLSGFLYWWGSGLGNVNDAVLIRYTNNALEISKRLWAFANYSRFVRPGAIRIGATASDNNLETTAFKNTDGSFALVVFNISHSDISTTLSLQNTSITPNCVVTPYLTDTSNNTARQAQLRIQQQKFSTTVLARSLVTYQVSCHKSSKSPAVKSSKPPTAKAKKSISDFKETLEEGEHKNRPIF